MMHVEALTVRVPREPSRFSCKSHPIHGPWGSGRSWTCRDKMTGWVAWGVTPHEAFCNVIQAQIGAKGQDFSIVLAMPEGPA